MVEAFVVTLREGVEAALALVLILACLRKAGRTDLRRAVFAGLTVAIALSIAAAVGLKLSGFDPEGRAEGVVLAVSAVLVAWLLVWMVRHGRTLKQATERKMREILGNPSAGQQVGLFLFSFLVVFREGVETVLLLSAVQFTTDAVLSFAGAVLGIALAVAFGIAFYKGSLRIDLRKFFSVTTIVLGILVVQLAVSSLHEFAEAGDLPFGPTYMKYAGPLIRNNLLFVVAVLVLPFALLLGSALRRSPPTPAANPAEQRKEIASARGQRAARIVASTLAILTIGSLGWAYAREKGDLAMEPPTLLESRGGEVFLPLSSLSDGKLHRYAIVSEARVLRFLAIRKSDGRPATTFDACEICRDSGYVQQGDRILCLNCTADINPATLGEPGGCNPVPLAGEIRDGQVVVKVADLEKRRDLFSKDFAATCPICRMGFKLSEAGGSVEGVPLCPMKECREELLRRKK